MRGTAEESNWDPSSRMGLRMTKPAVGCKIRPYEGNAGHEARCYDETKHMIAKDFP